MNAIQPGQSKAQIDFADFSKLDLRVGEVVAAREVEGSSKLLELTVDFGPDFAPAAPGKQENGKRTIYAGIREWYEPLQITGRKLIFVVNLAPKTFKIKDQEYVSEGMLMAAGGESATLYSFDKDLPNGTILR